MAKWKMKRVRVPGGMAIVKKIDPKTGKKRKMRVRRKGYMRIQRVRA